MIIIPAIDLKAGRCVRLRQGRMAEETVYSENPVDMALAWAEKGAERIHVVDLDGAVQGKPVNHRAVGEIVEALSIPVQLGGGIRDMSHIEAYIREGVGWVILGTAAFKDPKFLRAACREFSDRVLLAVDAHRGRAAVEGWTEETNLGAVELARRYEDEGIAAIVYTDIERDGMSVGPNVAATENLAKSIRVPVIASGGISGMDDVVKLLELEPYGVVGMITGRALYEGTLDLGEAIRVSRREKKVQ
ncbi:MAG: 1-(5-phosphoribosyl)-5-[(5-phosphoribosylamino)methylideneamino]imidazole-4-carboxamide isomerase [Deltaproteobacteria bacterium]|jgi:phosphoribosylformimino-5-aminoimidazole carboxamide ribotide isomerase